MDDESSAGTENIPKRYKTGQKSRWTAGILIFFFGPFGFLYFGFGACFGVIVAYVTLLVITGGSSRASINASSWVGTKQHGVAGFDTSTAGVATDSSANSFLIGLTQEGNTEIGAIIALLTTNFKNREN